MRTGIFKAMLISGALVLVFAIILFAQPSIFAPSGKFYAQPDERVLSAYNAEQLKIAVGGIKPTWAGGYDANKINLMASFLTDSSVKIDPLLLNLSALASQGYLTADNKARVIILFSGTPDINGKSLKSINGIATTMTQEEILALKDRANIKKIYLDYKVRVLDDGNDGSSVDNRNELTGATEANTIGYDGSGVIVAVVDTGVDSNHVDLEGKVIGEISFVAGESPADGYGHGTHVASTIAGSGIMSNGTYKGVATGAKILNVKVLDNTGSGYTSDIIQGMQWAADNGADIISMSLGGTIINTNEPLTEIANKLVQDGIVLVIAAGNSYWYSAVNSG